MSTTLCQLCGEHPGTIYKGIANILPFPVCEQCLQPRDGPNTHFMGRLSHLPTFSVEFEIDTDWRRERRQALVLLTHGYRRTNDGTVSDEYKSPIYGSLDAFRFHLPTLNSLRHLVNDDCGTHVHIGFPGELIDQLYDLRDEIFGPLLAYWSEDEATEEFWGRTFCYYASEDFADSYPCIRIGHNYETIEYRLPRFCHASQYLAVVRFCRRATYSVQRALTTLSSINDPYGESAQAKALDLTPEAIGRYLVEIYRDTLKRYWHQYERPFLISTSA